MKLPLTNKRWDLGHHRQPAAGAGRTRCCRCAGVQRQIAASELDSDSRWKPFADADDRAVGGCRLPNRQAGLDVSVADRHPRTSIATNNHLDAFEDERTVAALLKQRVWNDVPYGQISSDGQRAYMLDSLGRVFKRPRSGR